MIRDHIGNGPDTCEFSINILVPVAIEIMFNLYSHCTGFLMQMSVFDL